MAFDQIRFNRELSKEVADIKKQYTGEYKDGVLEGVRLLSILINECSSSEKCNTKNTDSHAITLLKELKEAIDSHNGSLIITNYTKIYKRMSVIVK